MSCCYIFSLFYANVRRKICHHNSAVMLWLHNMSRVAVTKVRINSNGVWNAYFPKIIMGVSQHLTRAPQTNFIGISCSSVKQCYLRYFQNQETLSYLAVTPVLLSLALSVFSITNIVLRKSQWMYLYMWIFIYIIHPDIVQSNYNRSCCIMWQTTYLILRHNLCQQLHDSCASMESLSNFRYNLNCRPVVMGTPSANVLAHENSFDNPATCTSYQKQNKRK